MPTFNPQDVEIKRGSPVAGRQFQTTGYSPIRSVDPKTGGGPVDMRGNPIHYMGQKGAPYVSVAGQKGMYPYNTPLVSPNFPQQQFRFVDTGSAPGITSGSTLDIATGSKQMMNSPYINQPAATFYQGTVPSTGGGGYTGGGMAGPSTSLGTTDQLYGGGSQISMGIDQLSSDQGPAYNTPYQFSEPFGFNTSGDFGAQPLPQPPGSSPGTGFQMPPMTSMPTVDDSTLLASSGMLGGTMSTDTAAALQQTPSLTVNAGDMGSTYGGGQNYNYSPAPDGGTYVYDANWNYVSTIPGQTDTSVASTPAAPTSSTPSQSSPPVADTPTSSPYVTQTQTQTGTIGSGFYGGSTGFGSASSGLYGGLEGGLSTGSVGGFSGMMDSGLGGGMGPPNVMRYL